MANLVGVRFKTAGKIYDFDSNGLELSSGDMVIVEVDKGLGMGRVAVAARECESSPDRQIKKVIRKADAVDVERNSSNAAREADAFRVCRAKIEKLKLPMKLVRVEYLFDSSKAVFYFTSDVRVDFRELVKDLASGFHTRIEMRQIGVRDESKMIGGLGPCGRELCCSGFLTDFGPVTIKMAKEQNLALNPAKISGICGRLMCCLAYEYDMYGEMKERAKKQAQADQAEGHTPCCASGGGGGHHACSGHGERPKAVDGARPQGEGARPQGGGGSRPAQAQGQRNNRSGSKGRDRSKDRNKERGPSQAGGRQGNVRPQARPEVRSEVRPEVRSEARPEVRSDAAKPIAEVAVKETD